MSGSLLPELGQIREQFLAMVAEFRPELHRYCARLTGSAVEGEDVVQETLAKAFYALGLATELPPLKPWLFRIAHNTAIDTLRRHDRRRVDALADLDELPLQDVPFDPAALRAALTVFLELPVAQRSAVILKDVLGHSLEETADTMGATVLAVKGALVRGRARLRDLQTAPAPEVRPALIISEVERRQLDRYVNLFNTRNWDALRALMGDECRLDLVSKGARQGKGVGEYFSRYAGTPGVRLAPGSVEGKLAALVSIDDQPPSYFVLLEWDGERVSLIRDYRYVPYIASEIALSPIALARMLRASPPGPLPISVGKGSQQKKTLDFPLVTLPLSSPSPPPTHEDGEGAGGRGFPVKP